MAYIINKFDGTQLAIIQDGVVDNTTALGLIGRNYTGYGETQNENFLWLLENFSHTIAPSKPLKGQIWHDAHNSVLKVFNGTDWAAIGNAVVAETEPVHSLGGMWLKSTTNQLFISNGTTWNLVGPEGVEGYDVTKLTSVVIDDLSGQPHAVILFQIDGETHSIYAKESFTISPNNAISGFYDLVKGLNLRTDNVLAGNVQGNAATASKLQTPISINAVEFDGSRNIVIKSSTTKKLLKGSYIIGTDWDGSIEDTWGVDATPQNLVGTVVARDSTGSFSASTVTANLFGDVVGNIVSVSGTSIIKNLDAENITGKTFTGNSATATKLQVPVTINTVQFDGTQSIMLPVQAGTLLGTTLASNVVTSSLTTVGRLTSLSTENAGITVGPVNGITLSLPDGTTPTIKTLSPIGLTLSSQDANIIIATAGKAVQLGSSINKPAVIPLTVDTNLGIETYPWKNVYSKNFLGDSLDIKTVNNSQGNVVFPGSISVGNVISGNVIGNVTGNVTGSITGNAGGAAALNVLKTGDALTGNLSWSQTERGLVWAMNTDSASIKFYNVADSDGNSRLEFNTGDNGNEYFRWTHSLSGYGTFEAMKLVPNSYGVSNLTVNGSIYGTGTISAGTFTGKGNLITELDANNITTGRLSPARLNGTYDISVTGSAGYAASAGTAGTASANILRSGDTMSGRLGQSAQGFHASNITNIANRTNSGFFDNPSPTIATGWPANGSWHHLLSSTHVNDANYYAMQLSADFYSQNLYYRSTAGNGNTSWSRILHSGNFNDYAPTKTGVGASGTWPISINGNAATVSSITAAQITTALGFSPIASVSVNNQQGGPISGTNGSFSGVLNLSAGSAGGIKFPNDPVGGGGDTASITYEGISTDRTRLRFRVSNDGTGNIDDKAEFLTPDNDGLLINNNVVLNAANYNNYAPTKAGAGAYGTWPISITGNANTVTTLGRQQIIDALGFTPVSSTSNPTGIYNQGRISAEVDGWKEPANQLTLREVYSNGYPTLYGNVITTGGAGGAEILVGWSGTTGAHADSYIRSRRDTGNIWSPWAKIVTDQNISSLASNLGLGFRVTYGQVNMSSWHSHVGWFHWEVTYGDVFPPAGKTMADLMGVIASNSWTYFAGGVNGDDIMVCFAEVLSDRIRIHNGNSEQRATPTANWLAIWRN